MKGYSYLYGMQSGLFIKVGWSRNPWRRLKDFQAGNPHPMILAMCRQILHREVVWVEARTHLHLHPHAIGHEWFMVDVATVKAAASRAVKELREYEREWCRYDKAAREARRDEKPCLIPMPDTFIPNPHKAAVLRKNLAKARNTPRGPRTKYPPPIVGPFLTPREKREQAEKLARLFPLSGDHP